MTNWTKQMVGAVVAVSVLAAGGRAIAQQVVSQDASVAETFTIEAVDYQNRLVTLKDADGHTDIARVGPEVKRFDELKVGDKVTFRYTESVVYAIRKTGQAAPTVPQGPQVVREAGARPGATVSEQITTSVVVTALDPKVPSIVVRTDEGRTMGFRVEDKNNITSVKVGDRVDITYTRAVAVRVESPK
jgi:Cu/Ag efflux protein CusF